MRAVRIYGSGGAALLVAKPIRDARQRRTRMELILGQTPDGNREENVTNGKTTTTGTH